MTFDPTPTTPPASAAPPRPGGFDFSLVPTSQSSPAGEPRRTRRRSGPDRSTVLTVAIVTGVAVALIAAAGITAVVMVNSAEDAVRADSAAFCSELSTTPGVLELPGFGWPTEVASLPDSVAAMRAYEERWSTLADLAHPTIRAEVRAIADTAEKIASSVEANQSINRPATLASIHQVTSQTVVPAWAEKYCD